MWTTVAADEVPASEPVLKTLLMTDLVGSTELTSALGDALAAQLFARHDSIARELMAKHKGLEIDKTDGFLIIFDRPFDAAMYALALHDEIAELARESGTKLSARAGIHLGEVQLRRNKPEDVALGAKPLEVEGIVKPTAARVMSLALPGQTLMAKSAFDVARTAANGTGQRAQEIVWLSHGAYRFKGIAEPQVVCEVGIKGRSPLTAPPSSEKAWMSTAHEDNIETGWRPVAGEAVPGWYGPLLERKLGEGSEGELWLCRPRASLETAATVCADVSISPAVRPPKSALLFYRVRDADDNGKEQVSWRLSGAVNALVIAAGPQEGTFVILTKQPLTCGRDGCMGLQLHDPKVSRNHCVIEAVGSAYVIREAQSRNGVFVNGRRITQEMGLRNGDKITIGDSDLVFYGQPTGIGV